MVSSSNTAPLNDKQMSFEHNPASESLIEAYDEGRPTFGPEALWEIDGIPSVDDAISSDGDVSRLTGLFIAESRLQNTGRYRFCYKQAMWNVCAPQEVSSRKRRLKVLDRTSTATPRLGIYEYVEEHGRTYHHYKQGSKSIIYAKGCRCLHRNPMLIGNL